jgi:hypothetical protein
MRHRLQLANSEPEIVCPHWTFLAPQGECVPKWWAGPPAVWVAQAVVSAIGMGIFALIVAKAAEVGLSPILKPIVAMLPAKANPRRGRRRRKRRR